MVTQANRRATIAMLLLGGCGAAPHPGKTEAALNQVSATPAKLSGYIHLNTGFVPDEVEVDARDVQGNYTATTRPGGATQDPNDAHCLTGSADWCYSMLVESALANAYVLRPIAYVNKQNPYRSASIPFVPTAPVALAGVGIDTQAPDIAYTPAMVTGTYTATDMASASLPIKSDYMSFNDLSNTYSESCGGSLDFCPYNSVTSGASPTYTAYLQPGANYNYLTQAFSIDEGPGAQTDVQYDWNLHLGALAQGQTLVADRPFAQVAQVSGSAQLPVPIYNIWFTAAGTTKTIDPITQNPLSFAVNYRTLNYTGPGGAPLANTNYFTRIFDDANLNAPITLQPMFTLSLDGGSVLAFPPIPLDFSQGNQITQDFNGEYGTISSRVTLVPPYPIKNGVYPGVQAQAPEQNGGWGTAQTTYVTDAHGASFVMPAYGTPHFGGHWDWWRFGWNIDLGDPNFTSTYFVGQFLNIPVQAASGGNNTPADFVFPTALVKVYFSSPANPPGTTITDPRVTAYSDDGDSANAEGLNQNAVATGETRMVLRAHNNGNTPVAFHLTPSAIINAGGAPGNGRTDFSPITLFPKGGDVTVVGVPGSIALTVTAPQEGQVFQVCQIPVTGLSTGQPNIGITVNGQNVAAPSTNNPGDPQQVGFTTMLTPPPGPLTITVTAADANGHQVSDTRHVSCVHPVNHAPQITCPAAITLPCASAQGATGAVQVAISDADQDALQITWTVDGNNVAVHATAAGAPSDTLQALFSAYGHTVTATAADGWGGTTSCTTTVNVANPLVATSVQTSQITNPNHTMVNVGWSFNVNDRCANVATRVVKVYSNEADVVAGIDGQYSPDAKVVNLLNTQVTTAVKVRGERTSPGSGRVYVIVHTVTDLNGHVGYDCSTVTVPIDGQAANITAVNNLAQAALATCKATGAAPGGYVQVGTGPIVGPYQ